VRWGGALTSRTMTREDDAEWAGYIRSWPVPFRTHSDRHSHTPTMPTGAVMDAFKSELAVVCPLLVVADGVQTLSDMESTPVPPLARPPLLSSPNIRHPTAETDLTTRHLLAHPSTVAMPAAIKTANASERLPGNVSVSARVPSRRPKSRCRHAMTRSRPRKTASRTPARLR